MHNDRDAGDEWNARGFFQDTALEQLQDAMFGPLHFPPRERKLTTGERVALGILLRGRRGRWGSKSSRAYALPMAIRKAMPSAKFLITDRPMEESAASWAARSGASSSDSLAIMRTVKEALAEIVERYHDSLVVQFHRLLSQPAAGVQEIAEWAGVRHTDAAIRFVDPTLRRF
jgi:hypothetical protein